MSAARRNPPPPQPSSPSPRPSSGLRAAVERASLPAVSALSRLPKPAPFLLVLGLGVAGVLVPGWGWVLILVVTVFLAWLLVLAWPRLSGTERLMRGVVVLLAAAITLTEAVPRG